MKSLKSTRVGRISAKNTAGAKSARTAAAAKTAAAAAAKASKSRTKTTTRAKRPAVKATTASGSKARASETKKKSGSATRNQAMAMAREALKSGIAARGVEPRKPGTAPSALGEELKGARERLAEAQVAGEALAADLERERARNEGLEAAVTQLNEQLATERARLEAALAAATAAALAAEPTPAFGVPAPEADAAFEAAVDEALEQAKAIASLPDPLPSTELDALRACLAAEQTRREQLEVERAQALSQAQLEREQRLAAMDRSVETANQAFAQWRAELEATQRRAAAVPELERELGVVRAERDELLLLRSEAQARCAAVEAELCRIELERDGYRERANAQAERIEFLESALALRASSVESFPPDGAAATLPAPDWSTAPPPPPPPGGLFGEPDARLRRDEP